jgi:putative sigma-54 modulation protein
MILSFYRELSIMNIQITGRKIEITESIRHYLTSKFEKLERHAPKISSAHFVLDTEPHLFKIETNIHVPGHEVFAESKDKDMYAAIDLLMDKIDSKLSKIKEKMHNHHHPSHHEALSHLHEKLNDSEES